MSNPIQVLIDVTEGAVSHGSIEALVCAQQLSRELSLPVDALVLGSETEACTATLSRFQIRSLQVVRDPRLAEYSLELYTAALAAIIEADQPSCLIMSHSYQNLDLAPRLAARIARALVTDCIGYRREEDRLVFVRQIFRNKLNANVVVRSPQPWIITLQNGAFDAARIETGACSVVERSIDLAEVRIDRRNLERVGIARQRVDLSKAEIIIGVGRGLKKQEHLEAVRGLAAVLGAEIGASRPVVDNGWLERDRQIGSSGQSVSPKLYIALGISGAIQHVVGIRNSDCIVAVNSDRNAPIFNIANFGLVADLMEVVPRLTARLRELNGLG